MAKLFVFPPWPQTMRDGRTDNNRAISSTVIYVGPPKNGKNVCRHFVGYEDKVRAIIAIYRVGQKMAQFFVCHITSPNLNRFSKFFHCQNQETICNKIITIDPTTPKVCRYTTL